MPSDAPPPLLIGLDLGTGRCKAVLATPGGAVVHVARRPTVTRQLPGGGAVHPVPALLATAEALLAECAAAAGNGRVVGIGVASMAEAGVPLDRGGRPIGDALAWFDRRPAAEAAWIGAAVGAERLYAITGLRAEAKATLSKLLWLRRRRPATIRRMHAWAGIAELLVHHLTGVLATNASLACRTLAFDITARRWDSSLLELAGVGPGQMAAVLPFGRAAAGLRADVARRVGLQPGIPVTVAGHDHAVGAFGVGVMEPGQAVDSMGSAEAVLVVTAAPRLDDRLRQAGISSGCHVLDGRWYVAAGLQQSGAAVDWFIDACLGGGSGPSRSVAATDGPGAPQGVGSEEGHVPGIASGPGTPGGPGRSETDRYASFLRLLGQAARGPSGLIVLPYLRGRSAPEPAPGAGLEIRGLRPEHGSADIALSILEGTACATRWMLEELERTARVRVRDLAVIGGGTRNQRWLEIKAAVGRWPLRVPAVEEATALGAALAAGAAAGMMGPSAGEPSGEPGHGPGAAVPGRLVAADEGTRRRYERGYRTWLRAARGVAGGSIAPGRG
ncbi:MAG: FGGY-family carbohydrate kinase [Candidatus Limnocylindrales bacterium]